VTHRTVEAFGTDTTICIGCKACEVGCKEWNELAADGLHWSGNSYDNTETLSATSWRHVKFIEQFAADNSFSQSPPSIPDPTLSLGGGMLIPLCLLLVVDSSLFMFGAVMCILLGSLVIRFVIVKLPHASA
jgi:hypothetical protein